MRLIDADDFKKNYCEENCGKRQCRDAMDKCIFIGNLDNQPTAYDLDKVVKELDKYPHGDYINVETMSDIIEIVKAGVGNDD